MGIVPAIQKGKKTRAAYAAKSEQSALHDAAWEVLMQAVPKKSEDSDLTYIPVESSTLSMKKGDLMVMYDLLPEIAVKAYGMIRGDHNGPH